MPGILVVFGVPSQESRCSQFHQTQEFLFLECLGTDHIDLFDASRNPLFDREINTNPVSFKRCNCCRNRRSIFSASQILAFELLLGFFQQSTALVDFVLDLHRVFTENDPADLQFLRKVE